MGNIVLLAHACRRARRVGCRAADTITLHGGPVRLRHVRATPCCNVLRIELTKVWEHESMHTFLVAVVRRRVVYAGVL